MATPGGNQQTTSPEQIEESTNAEILELMEPELDGFQLLEQLRNHPNPKPRKIPVVVYTVKELTGEERERLRQQTQGLFTKGDAEDEEEVLTQLCHTLKSFQNSLTGE